MRKFIDLPTSRLGTTTTIAINEIIGWYIYSKYETALIVRSSKDIVVDMPVPEFVKAFEAAHGKREKEDMHPLKVEGEWSLGNNS